MRLIHEALKVIVVSMQEYELKMFVMKTAELVKGNS